MNKLLVSAALLLSALSATTWAQTPFKEGRDYYPIVPAQHTNVAPGKIEVTEVFNYGCPFCDRFNPLVQQLKRTLPGNAQLVFMPVSFRPEEDFPMFARAFCTAQLLGLVDKTHDAMFDAVWRTGELAISDPQTNRLRNPLPSIEDAAKFYHRHTGVSVEKFIATARSFAVEVKMKSYDGLVEAYHVPSTPAMVINGKYLISVDSAGNQQRLIEIARWLIAQESAR
jgi:thiol:disulfide interchange protein DsbA